MCVQRWEKVGNSVRLFVGVFGREQSVKCVANDATKSQNLSTAHT